MPQIIAIPCPYGVDKPASEFASVRGITDDLPGEVVGECVAEAVHKAWKAGFDPALPPFIVIVRFL